MRPRLLDLYCGAGGAGMGYHRAGFDVVGVDLEPQRSYPFEFVQMDVFEYLSDPGLVARCFDAIHASPPCQAYSAGKNMWHGRLPADRHPDLVGPTRQALVATGLPWVIENVVGAPLLDPITLCGDSFGLGVKRHRLFESSVFMWNPPACRPDHPLFVVSVFGGGALSRTLPLGSRKNFMQGRVHVAHAEASIHMGIDWMRRDEMSQAIPPAYTEWVGSRLLTALEEAA